MYYFNVIYLVGVCQCLVMKNKSDYYKTNCPVCAQYFGTILPLYGISYYIDIGGSGLGVWNSLISKSLAHYSLSLKFLLIL